MPKPSVIDSLTPEQRAAFVAELTRRNFSDYDGLVAWAAEFGLEITRSAAHRYGTKVKRKLQAVKDSTEAARLIAEAAPDDADLRSAAVISLVQSELFDVMVTLQDLDDADPAERVGLLKEAARSVLDMTKASTMQKKWMQENEARIRREALEEAANKAADIGQRNGWSKDTVNAFKREMLGVPA